MLGPLPLPKLGPFGPKGGRGPINGILPLGFGGIIELGPVCPMGPLGRIGTLGPIGPL